MLKPASSVKPAAIALMALMAATRFHHFGNAFALPDATLAIFFAAGWWLGGRSLFVMLLLEAGLIDYMAITQLGASSFCVSPAYGFLVPTYAVMWLAGKWCSKLGDASLAVRLQQFAVLAIAVSLAYLISNGSFFLLSEQVADKSWDSYTQRFAAYYPAYLRVAVGYGLGMWALVQAGKTWLPLLSSKSAA